MSNQISTYQRVIEIVADARFTMDNRLLLLDIAKHNPQTLINAANRVWNSPGDALASDIVRGIRDKGWTKIVAIKNARMLSGMGLKDAKDYVESLGLDTLLYKNTHKTP